MPSRDALRGRTLLLILSVLGLTLAFSACSVTVEEPRKASDEANRRGLSPEATKHLPLFEVAVSAIDFDPPLSKNALADTSRPVKLVAAVENKGTMQLNKLTVVARIENQKGDFSEQDQVSIDKLIPGEARVVEFSRVTPLPDLPRSPSYRIRVAVDGHQLDSSRAKPSREIVVRVTDQ